MFLMLKTYKHIVNNINNCNFVFNLNLYVMIKKLLFIFITVFTFSNMSAQDALLSTVSNCVSSGSIVNSELVFNGLVNGKNSYLRTATPSTNAQALGVPIGQGTNTGIRFDSTDNRWELWGNNNVNYIVFYQDVDITGLIPPSSGWLSDGAPCSFAGAGHVVDSAVLNLEKEFLENKISIFPNPSSDFIYVSNINDATPIRITNITGQTVMSTIIDASNNEIDIKDLSKGFYFVEIEGKKTIKLIKK